MAEPEDGFQPWTAASCTFDQCRQHLIAYREGYASRSFRAAVTWMLMAVAGIALAYFEAYAIAAICLFIAAVAWAETRRTAQMVDTIGVLWALALFANQRGGERSSEAGDQ